MNERTLRGIELQLYKIFVIISSSIQVNRGMKYFKAYIFKNFIVTKLCKISVSNQYDYGRFTLDRRYVVF